MKKVWLKTGGAVLVLATALVAARLADQSMARVAARGGKAAPAGTSSAPPPAAPMKIEPSQVGVTLTGRAYWSTEVPFNDIVKGSGTIMVGTSAGWKPPEGIVRLDATGHPIDVAKGVTIIVNLFSNGIKMPAGRYHCRVSPGWSPSPFGEATVEGAGTKFDLVIQDLVRNGVALNLTSQRDGNALGDLACTSAADGGATFNRAFLDDLKPFGVVRFMQWANVNGQPPRTWATRPTPASFSQVSAAGVALEYMVDLANTAGVDPWFNLPFDADADYVRNYATYVRDHLQPGHKAYVELSNEVWNGSFPAARDSTARGKARYPGIDDPKANDYYYGDRVREVMKIWSDVFKGQESRIVRVYASQAVWTDRADWGLAHNDTWRSVDALATAPYFGVNGTTYPQTGKARVEAIFHDGPEIVGVAIDRAKAARKVAGRYRLRYMTYEGGTSFDTYDAAVNPDLIAVSTDPRIYDLYSLFLKRWKAEVGGLFMAFESVSMPSQHGSWGHKGYTGQPLADAPKMRAIADFVAANGLKGSGR